MPELRTSQILSTKHDFDARALLEGVGCEFPKNPSISHPKNTGITSSSSPGTYVFETTGKILTAGINEASDVRWKKDIAPISSALEKVLAMRGVTT